MKLSKRQALCARPNAEAALHQAALGRRAGKGDCSTEMRVRFVVPAEFGKEHATRRFNVRTAVDRRQRGETRGGAIGPADRHGARQLDEHQEAVKQAAVADRLLISKTDLADIDTSAHLRARLEDLNPGAPLFEVVQGEIDPALLFDSGPFDPTGKSPRVQQWLNAEAHEHRHHHERHDRSRHDAHIGSFCLTFDEPLDWDRFNRWLMAVRASWGDRLLRVKGVLNVVGESQPLVIHGVHRTFHPPTLLARWPDDGRRSRLVFITRDLDRAAVATSWDEME